MPETGAAFAALFAEGGGAAAAAEAGGAAVEGGGLFGGGLLGADAAAAGGAAADAGGLGAGLGAYGGAGAFGAAAGESLGAFEGINGGAASGGESTPAFGDAVAGYEGGLPSGTFGGNPPPAGGGGGLFDGAGDFFRQTGKGLSSAFGKGGSGKGILQIMAALYGLQQSSQLGKMARQPDIAGEQAIQRSLAAQGYQGSGNMMASLARFGQNNSLAASQAGMSPLVGQLSSLGLLTGGLSSAFGGGG